VKANAYGHGAVAVSRHLKRIGVERLAVATLEEAKDLRRAGIPGPIHLLGSMPVDAASGVVDFDIIPSICTRESAQRLSEVIAKRNISGPFKVHLKIDTGMSRVGVQTADVDQFVDFIESRNMFVEGMFTHFADAWARPSFTEAQLEKFEIATAPYKGSKLLHVSGSAGIIRKYGLWCDLIRPGLCLSMCQPALTLAGISLYGIPPDTDIEEFRSYGFEPALSWIAYPTLVKVCWFFPHSPHLDEAYTHTLPHTHTHTHKHTHKHTRTHTNTDKHRRTHFFSMPLSCQPHSPRDDHTHIHTPR
jgi:alanine racemase